MNEIQITEQLIEMAKGMGRHKEAKVLTEYLAEFSTVSK